jgi:hypothetical protein
LEASYNVRTDFYIAVCLLTGHNYSYVSVLSPVCRASERMGSVCGQRPKRNVTTAPWTPTLPRMGAFIRSQRAGADCRKSRAERRTV